LKNLIFFIVVEIIPQLWVFYH